jgi:hypothetical protein
MFGKKKKKKYQRLLQVGEVLVSEEVTSEMFTCDLSRCKGACCVEGELGAPLEEEERQILEDVYPEVEPYLPEKGKQAIREQGKWVLDFTGDYSTPLVKGRECAFTVFEEDGTAACGIEKAYMDGKIPFRKPISCHLYPIRISKSANFEALNYDRWSICSPACALGEKTQLRVYEFTRHALIRKYGQAFYDQLDEMVKMMEE